MSPPSYSSTIRARCVCVETKKEQLAASDLHPHLQSSFCSSARSHSSFILLFFKFHVPPVENYISESWNEYNWWCWCKCYEFYKPTLENRSICCFKIYIIFLYFVLYEIFSPHHYSFASLLTLHIALRAHTLCSNIFMCFNNSLEILGYELKVLLQSQIISYYMLCIDIYNKYGYR